MGKERWTLGLGPREKAAVAAVVGALLLLTLGVLAWRARQPTVYEPDANAAPVSSEKPLTPEEIRAQLQAQADESAFRVRINARPRVTGRRAELLLENPVENTNSLSVTITLNEGGETVFESGPLVPGQQMLTAELTADLPPGEHPATACCSTIDPETGQAVGSQALIDLVLTVETPPEPSPARDAPQETLP